MRLPVVNLWLFGVSAQGSQKHEVAPARHNHGDTDCYGKQQNGADAKQDQKPRTFRVDLHFFTSF